MPVVTISDGTGAKPLEMFLHQRFQSLPPDLFLPAEGASMPNHTPEGGSPFRFRFVGCRLVQVGGASRLLPPDLGVVLLRRPPTRTTEAAGEQPPKRVCCEVQAQWQHIHGSFTDPLNHVGLLAGTSTEPLHLLVKVALVGHMQRVHMHDRRKRLSVILVDRSCPAGVELVLWDNQTMLATLFQKGDTLAIQDPYLPQQVGSLGLPTVEYGSSTLLYCLPSCEVADSAAAAAQDDDDLFLGTQGGQSLRALRDDRV